jgi:hypothetical protein
LGDDRNGTAAQQVMFGSVCYCDAETTVPATCRASSSELWYELKVHQTFDVKEFRERFDCPSYVFNKSNLCRKTHTRGFIDFVYRQEFQTTFPKLDLFPSSGEGREKPILLGP